MPHLGPRYDLAAPRKLDGRTWQAKMLAATRHDLAAHVGGSPTTTQAALIARAAWLTVHLEAMDRRAAKAILLTQPELTVYTSMHGALARILDRLGTQPAPPPKPKTLAEHLAERAGQAA